MSEVGDQEARRMAWIRRIGAASTDSRGLDELVRNLAGVIGSLIPLDYVALLLARNDETAFTGFVLHRDRSSRWEAGDSPEDPIDDIARRVMGLRRPEGTLFSGDLAGALPVAKEDLASWVALPIYLGPESQACLLLGSRRPAGELEWDRQMIEALGEEVGSAVRHVILSDDFRDFEERVREVRRVHRNLIQENTMQTVLAEIVSDAPGIMRCDRCLILLPDSETEMLRLRAATGAGGDVLIPFEVPIDSRTAWGECLRTGEPLHHSKRGNPITESGSETEKGSVLVVPLLVGHEAIGVMSLENACPDRRWTDRDIEIGMMLATGCAAALEKARLYQAAKARESQYRALVRIGQAITSAVGPEEVFLRITDAARTLAGERLVLIFLLDEDQMRLIPVAPAGGPGGMIGLDDDSVAARAFRERMPVVADEEISQTDRHLFPGERVVRSMIAMPLVVRDQVLGVMVLAHREGDKSFGPEAISLLGTLCDEAAIAIEKTQLSKASSRQQQDLEFLSKRLLKVQEDERRRIARELHDETGQSLTAIKIALGLLVNELPPSAKSLREQVASLRDQIDQTIDGVRRLSYDLRPSILDDLGFLATLRWYADRFMKRTGIKVELDLLSFEGRLDSEIETAMYRVTQEILTNVARHADAQRTVITLKQESDTLHFIVVDDGKGFDPETVHVGPGCPGGLGLLGIRERVSLLKGTFAIRSAPGQGTMVSITLPLKSPKHR